MLRPKANKTSLYKLVASYTTLPCIRQVSFHKASRRPDYFMDWDQENGYTQAVFCACMGRPMLTVTIRDDDGHQLARKVYRPALEDLKERGMVEDFTPAAERRRNEMTAGGADNGGMSPTT